jgi:hypothetical protein
MQILTIALVRMHRPREADGFMEYSVAARSPNSILLGIIAL